MFTYLCAGPSLGCLPTYVQGPRWEGVHGPPTFWDQIDKNWGQPKYWKKMLIWTSQFQNANEGPAYMWVYCTYFKIISYNVEFV